MDKRGQQNIRLKVSVFFSLTCKTSIYDKLIYTSETDVQNVVMKSPSFFGKAPQARRGGFVLREGLSLTVLCRRSHGLRGRSGAVPAIIYVSSFAA